ncbi:hypothetical protein DYB28_004172 [Aphanomyces astaci]|uniref:C2H2-type domain-containing protein n=1 Tax=Aphanomyces astaci TaxID=112090 RepID=A0A397AVQ4_APHAT|nr:hypothetical protein DYB25_005246 [Aphanomyces astaci]RHY46910.1 hypothetical protein DYB30_007466 [Aphanomyces astaci]RHY49571.1 hypothetical protein DYB38_001451 [Aphanomyces astaci]RHZ27788.1 hypothetical protein DYB26_002890 [Aphanomyces astaci]RLO10466.1 hypothetical protein DYB28_004172 [Aphanomyces astaci]
MLTCTACREEFATYELQKEHFKLDWHRYNLKRKVVGLPPVSVEQFFARKADGAPQKVEEPVLQAFKCHNCNKSFSNVKAVDNHKATKKHQVAVKKADNVETITSKVIAKAVEDAPVDEEAATTEDDDEEEDVDLNIQHCMFCSFEADSLETNLTHMQKSHGFFIPDLEYLEDLEGFVTYLVEKVKLGHVCLYCNGKGKAFRTFQDCQKHMIDLSHCKLAYEEGVDLHEFDDFYDFTASYDGVVAAKQTSATAHGDDDEWEDVEEGEEEEEDELAGLETISISDTGNMVLPDGRQIGQRELRRYYKQRHRPEEARDSVLAQTKERLLLCYQLAGIDMNSTTLSVSYANKFLSRRTGNIAEARNIQESKSVRHKFQKHRERLETRSHKLQKHPNRKEMVTV